MRFLLTLRSEPPVSLPLAYNHSVQSLIYYAVSDEHGNSRLHNSGWQLGGKVFRLFTFGQLTGTHEIADRRITFTSNISLEVRSCNDDFVRRLSASLYPGSTVDLNGNRLTVVSAQLCMDERVSGRQRIRMLSPVVAYCTLPNGKTCWYSPLEDRFASLVDLNFRAKYEAFAGVAPESSINLRPLCVVASDKVVTCYKGFYITGWQGIYELSGTTEYLRFLYRAGLGGKNAQGFGMFEPL